MEEVLSLQDDAQTETGSQHEVDNSTVQSFTIEVANPDLSGIKSAYKSFQTLITLFCQVEDEEDDDDNLSSNTAEFHEIEISK